MEHSRVAFQMKLLTYLVFSLIVSYSVSAVDKLTRIGGFTGFAPRGTGADGIYEQQARETREKDYRQSISNAIILNKIARERQEKMMPILEERTVRFLKERTTNGSPEASFDLYERYQTGKGVIQDKEESLRYLKLSGEYGNEKAIKLLSSENMQKPFTNSTPLAPNLK